MRFGSLFAGIGGMDLGLEWAGMECAWQVEIDPFCRKVLAKHWPDVPKLEDVRDVGKHNLAPVDLICGGFPCQDISYAGRGAGLAGHRSGLWYEFARIIRELEPSYILVENVSALLTRGLGDVLGTLASFGYDAEWHCIPASALGAPHRRDRVFLVGHSKGVAIGAGLRSGGEGGRGGRRPGDGGGAVADATGLLRDGGDVHPGSNRKSTATVPEPGKRGGPDQSFPGWIPEPDVGRVAHGVPNRVDRLRGLGNAVVPQVSEWIGRRIMEADSEAPHAD